MPCDEGFMNGVELKMGDVDVGATDIRMYCGDKPIRKPRSGELRVSL